LIGPSATVTPGSLGRRDEEAIPLWEQHTHEYITRNVATGFVEAFGAFDADRVIAYRADDAGITPLIAWVTSKPVEGTLDELRLVLACLEASGHKQMLDACEQVSSSASGTSLHCTFRFPGLRSDELGLGPFEGSCFDLTVRDGEIVQASIYLETAEFSPQVWEPFAAWMEATYPDDAAVMLSTGGNGARLSEEAIPLWEQHTHEYVTTNAALTRADAERPD
jgi:hypothetical protein